MGEPPEVSDAAPAPPTATGGPQDGVAEGGKKQLTKAERRAIQEAQRAA